MNKLLREVKNKSIDDTVSSYLTPFLKVEQTEERETKDFTIEEFLREYQR